MDNDDVRGSFAEKIKMLTCLKLWSYKMHAFAFTFLKLYTETSGQASNPVSQFSRNFKIQMANETNEKTWSFRLLNEIND